MATDILAETGAPSYTELLNALCDLAFDPNNHAAQLEAQRLIDRVPLQESQCELT